MKRRLIPIASIKAEMETVIIILVYFFIQNSLSVISPSHLTIGRLFDILVEMISEPSLIEFEKGQKVVYPLQGVGIIQNIEDRLFNGEMVPYYIMYFHISDMTISIPVSSTSSQGIRAIVPRDRSEKALEIISSECEPAPTDWKLRYQMNLDLLRKGDVIDIATVVMMLYHRSKLKELPILERKLYDSALNLFIDELSLSLDKEKSEVEQLIFMKLESDNKQS